MAGDDEKKRPVVPASSVPTERDLGVLHTVHRLTDRIVLIPVQVNGEPRIALALLGEEQDGKQYAQVLAVLLRPDDVVLDMKGLPGYNNIPPVKKDLN